MRPNIIFAILIFVINYSCKDSQPNPFDSTSDAEPTLELPTLSAEPHTIAGLHRDLFKPTCANSGCHDGTFEPDFRTIESSYNTLVSHPIIKNDAQGTFQFRVVPFQADQSVIIARITYDIDGNSGIMPLVLNPDSDYNEKKEEHLQNLTRWINDGAPNITEN